MKVYMVLFNKDTYDRYRLKYNNVLKYIKNFVDELITEFKILEIQSIKLLNHVPTLVIKFC